MTEENKKAEDEIEFDIVEGEDEDEDEGSKPAVNEVQKPADNAAKEDDDDDDDDDEDDKPEPVKQSDELDEATREKRERRRLEKKEGRERKKRYVEGLEERVRTLTETTQNISARQTQFERVNAERSIKALERRYSVIEDQIADAVTEGNGPLVAQLMGERDAVRNNHSNAVQSYKSANQPQRKAPPAPDPRIRQNAESWVSANGWYKRGVNDPDSMKVDEIDKDIAASGVSPSSSLYWQLLDERVKKALPHKFQSATEQGGRQSPPVGSGKTTPGKGTTVTITPARKQALVLAGVWGDKAAMKPYLQAYAAHDKSNKTR